MSGSAPLTDFTRSRWKQITGIDLLERYGMSEAGMILSQEYGTPSHGNVGLPMPGVQCIIAKDNVYTENGFDIIARMTNKSVILYNKEDNGELLIKSEGMFKEYYKISKEITNQQFTKDGWFKTGDTVRIVDGKVKILGRTSIDIIKSGGYKISALEVETNLLQNEDIVQCCIVGVPDVTWGQKVAALLIVKDDTKETDLMAWMKDNMNSYEVPSIIKYVKIIETNAMGKINKKELLNIYFADELKNVI